MAPSSKDLATQLWLASRLPATALDHFDLPGPSDPSVNSIFRLGTAAQTSIGLSGLAAAHFHFLRTGISQQVTVNARDAVIEFHSEAYYTLDDATDSDKRSLWDSIAGLYPTKDGSYVRIHTNFPHHRAGILSILNLLETPTPDPISREDVASKLLQWDSKEFEQVAAERGMCATAMRSFEEWDAHPQANALLDTPPVSLHKIGDAPRRVTDERKDYMWALQGIRVLDLTRVIAGPVGGRALAAHGADVLWITSPNLPSLPLLDADTSRGKRTAQLDLNIPADCDTLRHLAKDCDVFLQSYRPGGLEGKGFGVEELAKLRPGIVCANLRGWGWDGPWSDRRAFDSLVQTATGFNVAEGQAFASVQDSQFEFKPRPLPMQAIDHAAGYFLAFGIAAALCKTITVHVFPIKNTHIYLFHRQVGGSWEVRVSLAGVGQWIRQLGTLSPQEGFGAGKPLPRDGSLDHEIAKLSTMWPVANSGREVPRPKSITAIKHSAKLSKTPVREGDAGEAPIILGCHQPVWLRRT